MPYHVAKSGKCPAGKPWAVIKDTTGEVVGCHPSEAKAKAQMAALYANEPGLKGQLKVVDNCPFGRPVRKTIDGTNPNQTATTKEKGRGSSRSRG